MTFQKNFSLKYLKHVTQLDVRKGHDDEQYEVNIFYFLLIKYYI